MKFNILLVFMLLILIPSLVFGAFGDNRPTMSVTTTVSSAPPSAGTWTSGLKLNHQTVGGFLNISIYGSSWAGTVTMQRSCNDPNAVATWCDVTTWTENAQKALIDTQPDISYRVGMKNGEYVSGKVGVTLSAGGK